MGSFKISKRKIFQILLFLLKRGRCSLETRLLQEKETTILIEIALIITVASTRLRINSRFCNTKISQRLIGPFKLTGKEMKIKPSLVHVKRMQLEKKSYDVKFLNL